MDKSPLFAKKLPTPAPLPQAEQYGACTKPKSTKLGTFKEATDFDTNYEHTYPGIFTPATWLQEAQVVGDTQNKTKKNLLDGVYQDS